ncbi:MAG: ACP S-malonyltransferase [Proteobacteria bacterium]|nr:ACP S-malonyltransferase [Pseudomonadota bacterium]
MKTTACVFPGQGSQTVGMLALYSDHPVVRETIDEASAILGEDLWALVANGPVEALALTTNTQPVMLAADVAVWRAWQAAGGPKPAAVAGHSLGEYAALVAAGALAFADALPLVRYRAQVMQEAVPAGVGAMAVVMGGDDDGVRAACAEGAQGQVVEAVNFNAPGQVVIAGHKEAVERTMGLVRAHGAKRAVLLPVSAPFHSTLLQPAADKLATRLAGVPFATPTIPVVHNVDVAEHRSAAEIRAALAAQAAQPVQWTQTVRKLAAAFGVTTLVECGPGKVLTNLVRRIDESLEALPLADDTDIGLALAALNGDA